MVAFVLILVLCIIKVKKLKVDTRKSGMHKYTVLKELQHSWCDVHQILCRNKNNKYKCMNTGLTLQRDYKMNVFLFSQIQSQHQTLCMTLW